MRENPILRNDGDDNPMGMLTNLFDIAMVFAVASACYGCLSESFQHERDFFKGRFHHCKESRQREYGDYYQRGE